MALYNSCKLCNSEINIFFKSKRIAECTNCKLIFFQERLVEEEVIELYKKLYDFGDDLAYHAHIQQQHLISNGIQPKLGYNKKIILKKILGYQPSFVGEIGAGVGVAGKYFKDNNIRYKGIEL